jgi:hypothetical protein
MNFLKVGPVFEYELYESRASPRILPPSLGGVPHWTHERQVGLLNCRSRELVH